MLLYIHPDTTDHLSFSNFFTHQIECKKEKHFVVHIFVCLHHIWDLFSECIFYSIKVWKRERVCSFWKNIVKYLKLILAVGLKVRGVPPRPSSSLLFFCLRPNISFIKKPPCIIFMISVGCIRVVSGLSIEYVWISWFLFTSSFSPP